MSEPFFKPEDFFLTGEDIDKRAAAIANAKTSTLMARIQNETRTYLEEYWAVRRLLEETQARLKSAEDILRSFDDPFTCSRRAYEYFEKYRGKE